MQQSSGGRGGIHRTDFSSVDSLLIVLSASAALAVRAWGEWPGGRTEENVFSALCWEEVLELVPSSDLDKHGAGVLCSTGSQST